LTVLKNRTEEQLRKQNIKSQMDVLMLAELRNGNMSGYDTIGYVHERFGVLLNLGTVYSHLYAQEREGLIIGNNDVNKRVYEMRALTPHLLFLSMLHTYL
jgi:DNA-binding PadR family transcriptional regulator